MRAGRFPVGARIRSVLQWQHGGLTWIQRNLPARCLTGTTPGTARCPGGRRAIPIACGSRRSCSSRRAQRRRFPIMSGLCCASRTCARWRRRPRRTCSRPGRAWDIIPARAICNPPHGASSANMGASCPPRPRSCADCPASGRTRQARSHRSASASAWPRSWWYKRPFYSRQGQAQALGLLAASRRGQPKTPATALLLPLRR